MFRTLVLHKDDAGFRAGIEMLDDVRLPPLGDGEVRVAVEYSTLNCKDGLVLTSQGPVVRVWPDGDRRQWRRHRGLRAGAGGRPAGHVARDLDLALLERISCSKVQAQTRP